MKTPVAKKYTFECMIQTLTYYDRGIVSVWAWNEEDARERAARKIMDVHRIGRNCFRVDGSGDC
jgi:hypothetical protein